MSGTDICKQGESTVAALYLVREGKVTITDKEGNHKEVIEVGGYFGDDQLLADASGDLKHANGSMNVVVKYTATVTEDCTCGVLTLQECTKIIDTKDIGVGKMARTDSMKIEKIALESLKRHSMLGAGTFGQVWLVSRVAADGKPVAYALKIQSKYELCQDGQAKAVINEKGIMSQLHHPFITNLVASYQDPGYVYMLMGMVQGGELYSIIHTRRRDGVKEESAKFYAAGIAEGLAYMHRRGFIYRDLKPENVMLDAEGYPVIVDFGFAKYLTDKTYTLCGTPLYLPPEVILNRGHTFSADHWSLGVLTYEMITGFTPFYFDGMEQMDLFRAIVKGVYEKPRSIHPVAASLIDGFLTKIPAKRLGSLAGGEEGVYNHPWFKSIDFDALRNKKIKAPHVPKIKDPLDASNFEDWSHLEDKTKAGFPKLKPSQEKLFKAF
jgi:protein kinase A